MSKKSEEKAEAKGTEGTEGKAPEIAKPRGLGVGKRTKELIRAGKSNKEVLEAIKAEFPEAKTTMASVNWYRNNLKQKGEKVPTAKEAKGPADKAPPPAKSAGADALGDALS